jgi:hypothetical protein
VFWRIENGFSDVNVSAVAAALGSTYFFGCIKESVVVLTRVLFVKTARRIQKPRAVQFLGEPIECFETARYLGVTVDTQLTWSAHVNQVGKNAAQRLGVLGPLLKRRSGLFVRNCVLLYKQLIRPMMDYACPIWRSAARSHVRKLQVITIEVSSHCD